MFWHTVIHVTTFFGVLLSLLASAFAQQSLEPLSKSSILSRIRARQNAIHSARISWTQTNFEEKGARIDSGESSPSADTPSTSVKAVPPAAVEYTEEFSFSFDGIKTNYLSMERMFEDSNAPFDISKRRTFNGEAQKSLRQPFGKFDYPYGTIYKEAGRNRDLGLLFLEPIIQVYRLLTPEMMPQRLVDFKISESELELRGVETLSLYVELRKLRRVLYVDKSRDFIPIRFSLESDANIQRQTDFDYRFDATYGWVLDGWEITKFAANNLVTNRYAARIHQIEINPRLSPDEFEITFPPNTLVDDLKEGGGFIQKADGSRRPIMPSEFSTPYKDLLNSSPEPIRASGRNCLLITVNLIVIAFVATYFLRKYHLNRERLKSGKSAGGG